MVLFYAVAGAMALASALLLVRPLLAGRAGGTPRAESDARIYRDQLGEIERDLDRGTVSADEAGAARAEIARRLLAAAEQAGTAPPSAPAPRRLSRLIAVAVLIGAPVLTAVVYVANGMPGMPDLPLDRRAEIEASGALAQRPSQAEAEANIGGGTPPPAGKEAQDYAALIARLEAMLEQRPGDAQGLALLANGYQQLGRHADAWRAFERLIDALGERATAAHFAMKAEAMVLAARGYVSPEAEQAIGDALARDPELPIARYYHGLLMTQSGHLDAAIATWERLRAEAPAGAPWLGFVEQMLAAARAERSGGAGPSVAEMEAAATLSPDERQAMIEGMVVRLEDRLTSEGGTPEEWLRLINTYIQLGRRDDAGRVARRGIAAFGSSTEAGFLREQALLMGVIEE